MTPELVSIPYSPWSIRARMALRYMGVEVRTRTYVPVLSTPGLRLRLRRPVGRVTLPVLFHEGPPVMDSLDIVAWGAKRSERPLIDNTNRDEVARWSRVSDRLLEAGRVRTTHRVLGDPEALRESLPPFLRPLGPVGLAVGRNEARRLLRKYGDGPAADQVGRMRDALTTVQQALGGRDTLLDRFSYADVTVAVGLSFVRPHADHPLGPRARRCWTTDELAEAFAPLLEWRDAVYARVA